MGRSPTQALHTLIVIGAGPAGLTAALEAARRSFRVKVFEAGSQVGGLAKTVIRDGNAFDIGGHRFFTKYPHVESWWREILGDDCITVKRQSRIFYHSKFYDYPLRLGNALRNLGPAMSARFAASYLWAKLHPRRPERTFEDWVSNRFGRLLFATFFKTYSEKVWGVSCQELSADWAAQRIKSLSLGKAIADALGLKGKQQVTTLIEQFFYPRRGPGMLWERVAQRIVTAGGQVLLGHRVTAIARTASGEFEVTSVTPGGPAVVRAEAVITSMALPDLIAALHPAAPTAVRDAAAHLQFRDFLTVLLVVNRTGLFPDNWIYLHDPKVRAGRLQNYGNWSAAMVAQPNTSCLGLEYFCQAGDDLWSMDDSALITLATRELNTLGFASPQAVAQGWVVREPKAYPRYDESYLRHVQTIARYLGTIPNLYTVGRNGMHRYNNQDHSMLTAMLAVENVTGTHHDLWQINVDDEYHEMKIAPRQPE